MAINDLASFLYDTGLGSISLFWMPIGIWTLLAALYQLFLKQQNTVPPQAHYQMSTALILALPLGALLAFLAPLSIPAPEVLQFTPAPNTPLPATPPIPMAASAPTITLSIFHGIGLLTLILVFVSLYKMGQLIAETIRFRRMTASLRGQALAEVSPKLEAIRKEWGIRNVEVFFSDADHVPMTFGWRKALIVIPRALQDNSDALHMTLVHELAHIRNADFIRQWVERIIAAFYFFHPLVQSLVNQIDQSREMNCDVEVLSQQDVSPKGYATLLLNFASPKPAPPALSLSMSDTHNNLKNRIAAMKAFPLLSQSSLQSRRRSLGVALTLLLVSALVVACEVNFKPDNSITIIETPAVERTLPEVTVTPDQPGEIGESEIFMIVEQMPELIGGLQSIQDQIEYPPIAQKAGIEGRVFIQFVVDEEGNVVDPVVVRGIGAGCDEEAIRAVQLAKFRPGRQRGQAVRVKMSLPITFRLQDQASEIEDEKYISTQIEALSKMLIETRSNLEKMESSMQSLAAEEKAKAALEVAATQKMILSLEMRLKDYQEQINKVQN